MAGILEVCVDSLASAQAAIAGGADRLELCSALAVGGLTPYAELLQQIRAQSRIKIRCLIRPRAGDFLYTKDEILLMAAQIGNLKRLGADGFVIGCLTADGELDTAAMQPLLKAAEGTGVTLHRCIDVISVFKTRFPQARAFHLSGKEDIESGMIFRREGVPMGIPGLDEWHIQRTDKGSICAARIAVDA